MADTISYKTRSRALAFLLTFLVTGITLLILLMVILYTPIPPFPEGGGGKGDGIELNLGFSEEGMGNNPQESSAAETEIPKPEVQAKPENEKLMTQDVEDAPSINESNHNKVKKAVSNEVIVPKMEIKKEPPKPVVNKAAMFRPGMNHVSADGNSKVAGDKGDPNGSLAAKAFGGKNGSGGSGGGSGGGTGSGTGTGVGAGYSYDISGRNSVGAFPVPEYNQQVEGVVVVEITVDKEGNVTQAEPGKKGTTVNDNSLWEAAREAARKAKFNRKPDAPAFQKGKIFYSFRLQ